MAANATLSRFPGETAWYDVAYAEGGTSVNLETGGEVVFRLHGQKTKDYPAVVVKEFRDGGLTVRARFTAEVTELMATGKYLLYFYWTPDDAEPPTQALAVVELVIKPLMPI